MFTVHLSSCFLSYEPSNDMHFRQLFSRRKARTVPTTKRSNSERKYQQQEIPQKKPSLLNPETVRTASNALEFALRTLSGITSGIPLGGALRGIINPLLEITGRIEVSLVGIIPRSQFHTFASSKLPSMKKVSPN
jgi:hypothetical protein